MASSATLCWKCQTARFNFLRTRKGAMSIPRRHAFSTTNLRLRSSSDPTSTMFPIFQPSFWRSVLPKRSRLSSDASSPRPHWLRNPSTHVIILALLAGSQAIQIISLKREHLNYTLRIDAHIAKLKEVIGRVQRGEDVDVRKELGTGDERREKEWEEVMKQVAKEDEVFAKRKRKREAKAKAEEQADRNRQDLAGSEESTTGDETNAKYETTSGEFTSSQAAVDGGNAGPQIRFY
ncbi:MAG: hypothetical protein Q9165_006371 [Trypethelium subeluteriae]